MTLAGVSLLIDQIRLWNQMEWVDASLDVAVPVRSMPVGRKLLLGIKR
jgi:hypothetical protein